MTLTALNHLLGAPSRAMIEKSLALVFSSRGDPPAECITFLANSLELEELQAMKLYFSLEKCIDTVLSTNELSELVRLYEAEGTDVDPKLQKLVGQLIQGKLEVWREASSLNRVSLPRYVEMDWTVHVKTSSSDMHRIDTPAVLIELHILDQPSAAHEIPSVNKVGIELTREKLETMLSGFQKIKSQLSALT